MKYKKDSLGTRQKTQYENRARHYFPRRTYTLVRIDGKAFHTWTRGLKKPFDLQLMWAMDCAAKTLCNQIMGCQFAYVQSDEISLLLTDFNDIFTQSWFDGSQSKIESVTASIATMAFNLQVQNFQEIYHNECRASALKEPTCLIGRKQCNAVFDSRAWTISDREEVRNYFIWRQQDAERNSLSMLASQYATHKELHGKKAPDRHDIIHNAGGNWNDLSPYLKRGRTITKTTILHPPPKFSTQEWTVDSNIPVFTDTANTYLADLIPELGA